MSTTKAVNQSTITNQDDLDFEKLYNGEIDQINQEMGLFLPPNLPPEMKDIWEEFFDILRYMHNFEVLDLGYVRKYLYDFFEMARKEPDELERKTNAVQIMRQKAKESVEKQKKILRLFYADQYTKSIQKVYEELNDEEKIEFLTYLNNGVIPDEVQALIDERDADELEETQLSHEEIAALQKSTIERIFNQYSSSKGKLNLGKGGAVVSAEAIDEFINQEQDEEDRKDEILRSQTRIRTLPNLPDSSQDQTPSFNSTYLGQNTSQNNVQNVGQNNIVNSNFSANQNPNSNPNPNQINPNFANQNQSPNYQNQPNNSNFSQQFTNQQNQNPQNNISNFRSNSQNSNTQNNGQNPSNFQSQQNNLDNPKAIPPRTRGLNDLLKK